MSSRRRTSSRPRSNNSSQGYYNEGQDTGKEIPADRLNRISGLSQGSLNSGRSLTGADELSRAHGGGSTVTLRKTVGLFSGVALIVGTMIGSGIFISPVGVARGSGSVGLSLVLWVVCGIMSMLGAIAYAELGTIIKKSGAEYSYLLDSFSSLNHHVGSITAFLFAWVNMTLLKPASVAIITLTFATYCMEPFYDVCTAPELGKKLLAAVCILLIAVINSVSVRLATWIQNVFTIAKLIALLLIMFAGLVLMGMGYTQYLSTGFTVTGTTISAKSVAIAIYNGMWAYDGWNNLNYVTEELVDAHKNLPRAILIGIPVVTVCYLLANVSYFTMISVQELIESPAVAVTWGNRVLGVMFWLIPLFVACSTFGAANGTMFSAGRLNLVAAREGHMVKLLSMVQKKNETPMPSVIFTSLMAIIFIIPGNIGSLIDFFSFAVWLFYGLTMVALIIIKLKWKPEKSADVFTVPIFVPFLVLAYAVFLVVAPIIESPQLEFLYAFLFIAGGLIFYFPFVHFKKEFPCMRRFNAFWQLLLNVEPPIEELD